MINLLPSDIKQERKYARHNRKLVMWLSVSMLGIASLFIISAGGFALLQQSITTQQNNNQELSNTLVDQQVDSQIAEFKSFSDDLQTVTRILDQQYLFSNLVQRIGGTLPPNSVLSGISLTGEDLTLSLVFEAIDNTTANQILINLNDNENGLFEQADTLSISCTPVDPDSSVRYPCSTAIKVLFFEDSDFVLLNGLLTEQALADALDNTYASDDVVTEQVTIDGLKNTFNISILSNSTAEANASIQQLRDELFEYTDADSSTQSIPYFERIETTSQSCPGSITSPLTNTEYDCRTTVIATFNLNTSQQEVTEEINEQNGIDSLKEDFVEAHGTKRSSN